MTSRPFSFISLCRRATPPPVRVGHVVGLKLEFCYSPQQWRAAAIFLDKAELEKVLVF